MVKLALTLAFPLVPFTLAAEPVPSPGVEILAEGCSPYATGDRATFVLNIVNPGPARAVQIAEAPRAAGAAAPGNRVDGPRGRGGSRIPSGRLE